MKRANGKERKRSRTLSDDELRAVWNAPPVGDTFGDLIKLLILTGQRREKVVSMKWDDVSDGVLGVKRTFGDSPPQDSENLPCAVVDHLRSRGCITA
jgi:integrase